MIVIQWTVTLLIWLLVNALSIGSKLLSHSHSIFQSFSMMLGLFGYFASAVFVFPCGTLAGRSDTSALIQAYSLGSESSARASVTWEGDDPELCQVSTGVQVLPTSTCADFARGTLELSQVDQTQHKSTCRANLKIQALKGETESAQLLLRIPSTLTSKKKGSVITSNSFEGLPHGVECQALQVGFVFTNSSGREPGSGGGWRPDPLRPLAPNTGVESNVAQPLWLQCFVSEQAVDGKYDAEFQLSLDPGGSLCVDLSFEIWKYSIPPLEESKTGSAWRGFWRSLEFEPYYGSEYRETHKKAWFDLMLKHRTPPDMVRKQPRPLEDFVYIRSKGTKWMGILNVGAYSSGQQGGCPHFTNADLASILASIKPTLEGLKAKGLQNYSYVYGFDEVSAQCEPQLRQVFGAVKQAFPGLKTMAAINWKDVPVDLPLDVWVLQYQLFQQSESPSKWTEAKKELWLYHCIEPSGLEYLNTFVERPSVQGRLLFWLAALWEQQYGSPSGWLYYEMNLWKPCNSSKCGGALQKHPIAWLDEGAFKGTAFTDWPEANFIWQGSLDTIFANGDGQFVYPCPDGPCGSVRMDALRDGLEDWELFRALGPPAVPLIQRVVQSPTIWNADPQLVQSIRAEAAKMLANRGRYDSHEIRSSS